MPTSLRCVFYDPDAVDADSRLSERAFEACARADVEVFALAGEDTVETRRGRAAARSRSSCARSATRREQCIGVGAALAGAPVGAVWVSPLDLEVRGPTVRVAEEGDELLYEAVIAELATRRSA